MVIPFTCSSENYQCPLKKMQIAEKILLPILNTQCLDLIRASRILGCGRAIYVKHFIQTD